MINKEKKQNFHQLFLNIILALMLIIIFIKIMFF